MRDDFRKGTGLGPDPGVTILAVAALSMLMAAGLSPAHAQIPDEFKNLQVLPKDIKKAELVGMMRGFAGDLGVRCTHCHVGEEGKPLSTYDFASDEKTPKKVGREMIRMTRDINGKYLANIDTGRKTKLEVSCATCHHGLSRPDRLEDLLMSLADEQDAAAALVRYKELREKYLGGYQYDFGPGPLNALATHLADVGKMPDAVKVAEYNFQLNPERPSSTCPWPISTFGPGSGTGPS